MDKNQNTNGEVETFILENNTFISNSEVIRACMLYLVL